MGFLKQSTPTPRDVALAHTRGGMYKRGPVSGNSFPPPQVAAACIRSRRKAGELLDPEREKRGGDQKSNSHRKSLIDDAGIDHNQSARYQAIARICVSAYPVPHAGGKSRTCARFDKAGAIVAHAQHLRGPDAR